VNAIIIMFNIFFNFENVLYYMLTEPDKWFLLEGTDYLQKVMKHSESYYFVMQLKKSLVKGSWNVRDLDRS
jgi:predicted ABC-type exoprotein transport system permease subunit